MSNPSMSMMRSRTKKKFPALPVLLTVQGIFIQKDGGDIVEQLIKKINMIDILGMMIPGGLMLVLLEKDTLLLNHLRSILCNEGDHILWSIVFLCISYFTGMLLHEIGSVIEKILWKIPWMNPRVYAAINTDLLKLYGGHSEFMLPKVCWIIFSIIGVLALIIIKAILLGVKKKFVCLIGIAICVVPFIVATQFLYWRKFWDVVQGDDEKKYCMRTIIRNEKYIQKDARTTEENARKYGLFCGYHAMFRSFLVMVLVLQIYVYFHPDFDTISEASWLVAMDRVIRTNKMLRFLRYATILAAVLRYWHFACTRFTYLYNGYIYNKFPDYWERESNVPVDVKIGRIPQILKQINDAVVEAKQFKQKARETEKWIKQQDKNNQLSDVQLTDEQREILGNVQEESSAIIELCKQVKNEYTVIKSIRIHSNFPVSVLASVGNRESWPLQKLEKAVDDADKKIQDLRKKMSELQEKEENLKKLLSQLNVVEQGE